MTYLQESVEKLEQEEKLLAASDRRDEANLVKIRTNVYGICKTYYNVVSKTKEGVAFKEEYLSKLSDLPKNWKVSYDKAKEHNDVEKIVIEEIKLQTLQEIIDRFMELEGNCYG
jgi:hypothetical protein